MTLLDLEQPLRDSNAVATLAKHVGITEAQAKAVFAAIADMDIRDVLRISETARRDRVRQINREARK